MIGKDAQVHLLEAVLEEMKRARVQVLEFGIHHLIQSKTSEVKNVMIYFPPSTPLK